jgi:quinol monooxygenase YgiN
MSERYGMHVRFQTQPDQGDAFADLLLGAAAAMTTDDGCLLYLVSRDPEDATVVSVTEVWTSEERHAAAVTDPRTRAVIAQAMPLLAGPPQATPLVPVGGHGLDGVG